MLGRGTVIFDTEKGIFRRSRSVIHQMVMLISKETRFLPIRFYEALRCIGYIITLLIKSAKYRVELSIFYHNILDKFLVAI